MVLTRKLAECIFCAPATGVAGVYQRTSEEIQSMKTHVKKGDTVQVIAGSHKGKRGAVLSVNAAKGTVIVEGARVIKKATRPSEQDPEGGIKELDGPIHISNVKKVS